MLRFFERWSWREIALGYAIVLSVPILMAGESSRSCDPDENEPEYEMSEMSCPSMDVQEINEAVVSLHIQLDQTSCSIADDEHLVYEAENSENELGLLIGFLLNDERAFEIDASDGWTITTDMPRTYTPFETIEFDVARTDNPNRVVSFDMVIGENGIDDMNVYWD